MNEQIRLLGPQSKYIPNKGGKGNETLGFICQDNGTERLTQQGFLFFPRNAMKNENQRKMENRQHYTCVKTQFNVDEGDYTKVRSKRGLL